MLKLISWNVNGLRACYDKGFADAFRRLDADFSACRRLRCRRGNWMLNLKDTVLIGIMQKRKVIRAQLFFSSRTSFGNVRDGH